MKVLYFLFISSFLLNGCASFERNPSSGYGSQYSYRSEPAEILAERLDYKKRQIASELGINPEKNLSPSEQRLIQNRLELKRLERNIASSAETKQYYNLKPLFENDSERIHYLQIQDPHRRQLWAQQKGIYAREENFGKDMDNVIAENDIAIGMINSAVEKSWGKPNAVETAGNPIYGNQRWIYNHFVSDEEGYKNETRIVYFEGGQVVGWECR